MGFKDLQVLVLLVWLCLGHPLAQQGLAQSPPPSNKTGFSLWSVSSGNPPHMILRSHNRDFSFDLMFTNRSKDSCAAVVQHVPSNTTVWVANFKSDDSVPTNPVQTCFLNFTKEGPGLVLWGSDINTANSTIWTTNLQSEQSDSLVLDDYGALDIYSNTSNSVWKSFDNPGDTLVNRQKLPQGTWMEAAQPNRVYSTGGIFSMRIQGPSLTLHQAFIADGTSGNNTYLTIPGPKNKSIVAVQMQNGLVAFYDKENSEPFNTSEGGWDYARLESDGSLMLRAYGGRNKSVGNVSDDCLRPAFCGSFGLCSQGGKCECPREGFTTLKNEAGDFVACERRPVQDCNNVKLVNITGYTYWNTSAGGQPLNRTDCETRCKIECDCDIALHVPANGDTGRCFLKLHSMQTIRRGGVESGESQMLFFKIPLVTSTPAPSPAPSTGGTSRRTAASAFAGGAGALVLLLLGVSAYGLVINRRKIFDDADRGVYDAAVAAAAAGKPPPQQLPPRYAYQELGASTSGFRHAFGKSSVYFGTLPHNSDTKIAVKALDDRGHRDKDFLAAVATMSRLSHLNLVPLLGYCIEGKHKMLVYELVNEGKSLSWLLFDAGAPTPDTATRRAIALGAARGLQHLHHNGVLHGGVKPENILIDAHRHPKLVDYGLLDLLTRSKALQAADRRGARGYMAPESLYEGPLTAKADVYSFGVVMLELVSGRRCLVPEAVPEERYLPAWGLAVLGRHHNDLDSALELADPRLDAHVLSETDQQVLKGMACVALRCVQADPALRPSMDEVVLMLNSELTVNAPPPSPALDDYADKLCTATQPQQDFIRSPSLSENSDMRHR